MAEIKSTLDIVLEKTKHLVLTPEERRAMEQREHLEKVPGMVQRFVDGAWTLDQMMEAWRSVPEPYREEARRSLLQRLLGFLSEETPLEKFLSAFRALASPADAPFVDRLERLAAEHADADRSWETRRQRLLAQLAEKGVRGDAVHVTPALDPQWQESYSASGHTLQALKAQWLAALAETAPLGSQES
ncbi:hypothetical protein [Desulfosoma caldarium]|uniref:Uncharacterized protein n=1 Tax=Desulfosoma caldarium TaxID=610254 RepID=A0A3N1UVA2_9BACT|nr:hypothetical protein [Desulfosoma caldarium]ROQ91076.1 hypothetical protein EDC27_2353 [Desulfosoma caldarium]